MGSFDLYEAVIPAFTKAIKTANHVLDKAEEYAKEKGVDANAFFIDAKLIEDQWAFRKQIQNISRVIRTNIGRLDGSEVAAFTDRDQSIAELRKYLNETADLLKKVDAAKINARQEEKVPVNFGKGLQLSVREAVLNHGQPNVFFHLVTAYSILRFKGVQVGKADYLSGFLL